VKIAVSSSGRQRPAAAMIALASSVVGISTPTRSVPQPYATFFAFSFKQILATK
jgi:hypothetical protein